MPNKHEKYAYLSGKGLTDNDYVKLGQFGAYDIYQVNTSDAATYLSAGTEWCFSQGLGTTAEGYPVGSPKSWIAHNKDDVILFLVNQKTYFGLEGYKNSSKVMHNIGNKMTVHLPRKELIKGRFGILNDSVILIEPEGSSNRISIDIIDASNKASYHYKLEEAFNKIAELSGENASRIRQVMMPIIMKILDAKVVSRE